MKCPKCGSDQSYVANTRHSEENDITRRQRNCVTCGHIWYTVETHEGKFVTMRMKQDNRNDNLIKRLRTGIDTARGVDNDFVYITIGDAKRILRMLESEIGGDRNDQTRAAGELPPAGDRD